MSEGVAARTGLIALPSVIRYADAAVPSAHGAMRLVVYRHGAEEHVAIVRGEIAGPAGVLARVHSECWTGEVFGSLRCDCRGQLDLALERIADAGAGVIVYLRQEGRGIGLGNKVRAYALQAAGADTVEANLRLGFAPDLRRYELAAAILQDLEVRSIALLTNNPDKVAGLEAAGVRVDQRLAHWVPATAWNASYLQAKRDKMGHLDGAPDTGAAGPRRNGPAHPAAEALLSLLRPDAK